MLARTCQLKNRRAGEMPGRRRAILQALHQPPSTRPLLYPRQHDLVHAGEDVSARGHSLGLTGPRRLPVCPDERTFSGQAGMSQRGQQLPLNMTARSCIRSRLGRFLMPQSLFWLKKTREAAKCYRNQLLIVSIVIASSSFTPGSSRLSQSLLLQLHYRLQQHQMCQRADTSLV